MQRKNDQKKPLAKDASRLSIGIVVAEWNGDITDALLAGAQESFRAWGVKEKNITIARVPGSFEIPFGCLMLIKKRPALHAIVALGCIIKGETKHDEYIATAVTNGIMQLSLTHGVPIGFGVVTTNNLSQARARSKAPHNHGSEAAEAALKLALLK